MYDDVLVATAGGTGSEVAMVRGLDLARTFESAVHALYVVDTRLDPVGIGDDDHEALRERSEKHGRSATERIAERAAELNLDAAREVREGVPHLAILDYVAEQDVDLVILGTHGRTDDHPNLGSTAERVIALADVPVLSVPPASEVGVDPSGIGAYDDVVVATDGSETAARAADHGLRIAERYGADVHVTYVVDETTYRFKDAPRSVVGLLKEGGQKAMDEVATEARERSLPVATDLLRGVPDEEILGYADGVDADLVVMGTRGGGGAPDPLLGSVTARVLRQSGVPVLTLS